MHVEELAKTIDHTLLAANSTASDVDRICGEAIRYHFAAVCIFPHLVPLADGACSGTDVKVCTRDLVSLRRRPGGCRPRRRRRGGAAPTRWTSSSTCRRFSQASSISCATSSPLACARHACRAVTTGRGRVIVKAIIETCYLDEELKRLACRVCEQAGVDFVKTSTGLGPKGATAAGRRAAPRLPRRAHRHQGVGQHPHCLRRRAHGQRRRRSVSARAPASPSFGRLLEPEGVHGGGLSTSWTTVHLPRSSALRRRRPRAVRRPGRRTGEVLMVAYANAEAMGSTLEYRRGALLEPQPARAVAQGRHQRQRAARGLGET